MAFQDRDPDWPFPSVFITLIHIPDIGVRWNPGDSEKLRTSYLDKFGVIPAIDPETFKRKLVRLGADNEWIVTDPQGDTPLEQPPYGITDPREILRCLTQYSWYSVGYSFNGNLIEFDFASNGEGYSRHMEWGFHTVVPTVLDAYWRYEVSQNQLHIEWEDASISEIDFILWRQLHGASSKDGSVMFYEMTLIVSQHLFPPNSGFLDTWPKEYWGKQKSKIEEE